MFSLDVDTEDNPNSVTATGGAVAFDNTVTPATGVIKGKFNTSRTTDAGATYVKASAAYASVLLPAYGYPTRNIQVDAL